MRTLQVNKRVEDKHLTEEVELIHDYPFLAVTRSFNETYGYALTLKHPKAECRIALCKGTKRAMIHLAKELRDSSEVQEFLKAEDCQGLKAIPSVTDKLVKVITVILYHYYKKDENAVVRNSCVKHSHLNSVKGSNPMNIENLITEYSYINDRIKELTLTKESLKAEILKELPEPEDRTRIGRVTFSYRKQYSVKQENALEALSKKKVRELLILGGGLKLSIGQNKELAEEYGLIETKLSDVILTVK